MVVSLLLIACPEQPAAGVAGAYQRRCRLAMLYLLRLTLRKGSEAGSRL